MIYVEKINESGTDKYFSDKLFERGIEKLGAMPIEGFDPELYKGAFPGFVDSDFDNAEAIGGKWVFENNNLEWIKEEEVITSADGTITEEGLAIVLDNLSKRLQIEVNSQLDVDRIIDVLSNDNLINNFCESHQRNVDACIEIYQPVCGWNNPEKIQCIRYPCATTY